MSPTSTAGSPVPSRKEPALFNHPALFYRSTDEYLAGCVSFVRDGLANNDAVAVAVPGPRLTMLADALGAEARKVSLIDMTEAGRNPGRIIGGVLRSFADRHTDRIVRIIGEPLWPTRSALEYPSCAQHEALINRAFAGRQASILCPYDLDTLDSRALSDATRTHPVLIERGERRFSPAYDPDEVIAEANQPLTAPLGATRLTVGAGQLSRLRQWAVAEAEAVGLSEQAQADWVLILTELVTNSIEHGGGQATVRLFAEADQLVGQVSDRGGPLDPLAGRRPAAPDQLRGRGLLLVYDLAHLVRLHTEPGSTTLEVRLRIE